MRIIGILGGSLIALAAASARAGEFYVAPAGDDANPGTKDRPFATITRARDAVRQAKLKLKVSEPMNVFVRGGTYYLKQPLVFGPKDSGTAEAPVTYTAHENEKVVLSGGRVVTGWKTYRDKIRQCDLKALGLDKADFKQLFHNGRRQPLARVPNFDPEHPRTGGFFYVFEGGLKDSKRLLKYDPARFDPSGWARPTLARVAVYSYHNWTNNTISIAKIDRQKHIITLAADASYQLMRDTRFYVQNVFEELDAPGEWYLDRESATLYFRPPDDKPADGSVVVPVLDGVIQIKGTSADSGRVEHLRIAGFAIRACRATAVRIEAARHCTIAKCIITNTGADGIAVAGRSSKIRLVGNDLAHIGSVGIRAAGQDILVSNNHLHDVGDIDNHFNHAIRISGKSNVASHNLIHDVPAWGIVFHGHGNIMEYNDIHHFGLSTNLAGGIYAYALKNPETVGDTTIRFNKITDATGYGMIGPGQWRRNPGWALWLDDMISNTTIFGNIMVRNMLGGVQLHGGKNNVFENNIMGAGLPSTMNHIRPGAEPCNNKIARNIIYYSNVYPRLLLRYGWTVKGFTKSETNIAATPVFLCGWSSVKTAVSASDHNLFFPIRGKNVDALLYFRGADASFRGPWADAPVADRVAWWRKQGFEAHSITADPLFVDAANDDYRLKPESPALKLGFKPIPADRIGLFDSPDRASWPVADHRNIQREKPLLNPR